MKKELLTSILIAASVINLTAADPKLSGTPIGTSAGIQYTNNGVQNVQNIQHYAFDGDVNTYFATQDRSYTWVGLDLSTPYIITKVGWSPRNDNNLGSRRMRLGVIQGANSPDFLDAVPIYVIKEDAPYGVITYGDVSCTKGFRYVRFVSTGDSRCNIAELEFYGHEGEGSDDYYYQPTNLATVIVNTVNSEEPYDKEHDIVANIIMLENHGIDLNKPGTIRERGNASRSFPKKPWRLKFDKKQSPLDATAEAKKWTLINNYGDKTLMRNIVAFEIARKLDMAYVPYARAVDVILNGEYKGCYQLCDQMEVKENRVDIVEMNENDLEGEALTGGYFFEIDAYADGEPNGTWFTSPHKDIPITIKSPDLEGDLFRAQQFNYIRNYFGELESKLYSVNFTNPDTGYRSILDIESFLKHFIVGELAGNTDTYWSTYMYKDRGNDTIFTGPVWDFDLAFANDQRVYNHLMSDSGDFLYRSGGSAANGMVDFVNRIIKKDPATANDLTRIWSNARNVRNLSADSINAYIDRVAAMLDESQALNFKRWPILGVAVHQNVSWALPKDYPGEITYMKKYVTHRFPVLDRLMKYDANLNVGIDDGLLAEEGSFTVKDGSVRFNGKDSFAVYTLSGSLVYSGHDATPKLPAGIYVALSRGHHIKFIVR